MRFRLAAAGLAVGGLLATQLPQFAQETTKKIAEVEAPKLEAEQKQAPLRLVPTAKAFLETLSDEQCGKATMEYTAEQRVQWHFIPMKTRKGLPIMEMKPPQREAAMQLLQASVSNSGFEKAQNIMRLESVLKQTREPTSATQTSTTSPYSANRDPKNIGA